MPLSKEQRGVATGVIAAVVTSIAVFLAATTLAPVPNTQAGLSDRLALYGACMLAPGLILIISVARLANHRFFNAQDIGGSASVAPSETARVLQALLQNTLEQAVLSLVAYACWCALAPARVLLAVPAAAMMFLVGRLCFFTGYRGGAASRSFGFALTFYPTVALMVGNACFVVSHALA